MNSDLASALEAQKAEAEAKRRKAEEDAMKAAEALYKKKFPEFEFAGVSDKLKNYKKHPIYLRDYRKSCVNWKFSQFTARIKGIAEDRKRLEYIFDNKLKLGKIRFREKDI